MRVLKVGGNELSDSRFVDLLAARIKQIIVDLSGPLIVVHGGGRAIAEMQAQLGLETVKVDGLRVTDSQSLFVAEMVLSGHSNKILVKALLAAGVDAIGLSGVDGGLLRCHKKQHPTADLGFVGEIEQVRADLLAQLAGIGQTVVLSPISLGQDGMTYNVNADEASGAVARAVGADQIDFISNVPGVMDEDQVISRLTAVETEQLIKKGVISGGMIPKVRSALQAIEQGVPQARIVNLTGLTTGGGTTFVLDPPLEGDAGT